MRFYLYRHIRHDKNEPFYIGVGTKQNGLHAKSWKLHYSRAFTKNNRNNYWKNIVNKTSYDVEILYESNDYQEILDKEKFFITLYGRKDLKTGTLVNLSDGGEKGQVNCIYIHTEKRKQTYLKMSNVRSKELYLYNLNDNFIKSYKNIEIAAKDLGIYKNSVSTALNSKSHLIKKDYRILRYYKEVLIKNVDYLSKNFKVILPNGEETYYSSLTQLGKDYKKDRNKLAKQLKQNGFVVIKYRKVKEKIKKERTYTKIYMYNNKFELLNTFNGHLEASLFLKLNVTTIYSYLCKKKFVKSKNYLLSTNENLNG